MPIVTQALFWDAQVRPVNFGGLRGISSDAGDPEKGFWAPMINMLRRAGYQAGQDILGAPYDWRLAPSDGLVEARLLVQLWILHSCKCSTVAGTMPLCLAPANSLSKVALQFTVESAVTATLPPRKAGSGLPHVALAGAVSRPEPRFAAALVLYALPIPVGVGPIAWKRGPATRSSMAGIWMVVAL